MNFSDIEDLNQAFCMLVEVMQAQSALEAGAHLEISVGSFKLQWSELSEPIKSTILVAMKSYLESEVRSITEELEKMGATADLERVREIHTR